MSVSSFLIVLAITIVILCVLTIKFKVHPVLVLFICALFVALCGGNDIVSSVTLIKNNFGSTLGSVGVMIIFGSIIASGVQDTGAVTSMVNWFIKVFKGKRLELAPALTGFIMSIPVFGDIPIILNAPIAAIIAKRKNMSMTQIAPIINLGLTLTHGMVPPTPGILAVSVALGADLGMVIIWGLVCSIISFVVVYFTLCPIYAKMEYIEPLAGYTTGIEPVSENASVEELLMDEEDCPNALAAFLPLLLPAIMIAVGAIGKVNVAEESAAYAVFNTLSDGVVALSAGVIATMCLAVSRMPKVRKSGMLAGENVNEKSSFFEVCCNSWVVRALNVAIAPLMITAMGGAMGGILRGQEAIQEIGNLVASSNFPKLCIPFILAAILMGVCGSMTTAALTAAALIAPMLPALGLSPVAAALAIGAGSMCFWHANNSGFWIFTSLYGFNTKQGYIYFTGVNLAGGVAAFIVLFILNMVGIV